MMTCVRKKKATKWGRPRPAHASDVGRGPRTQTNACHSMVTRDRQTCHERRRGNGQQVTRTSWAAIRSVTVSAAQQGGKPVLARGCGRAGGTDPGDTEPGHVQLQAPMKRQAQRTREYESSAHESPELQNRPKGHSGASNGNSTCLRGGSRCPSQARAGENPPATSQSPAGPSVELVVQGGARGAGPATGVQCTSKRWR